MKSLLSGILSKMGDQGIKKIAQSAGVDSVTTQNLLAQAGPLIMAKMADNTQKPEGLVALDAALLHDHYGSIFNRIEDLTNPAVDTKGSNILNHIFGGKVGDLVGALSATNNTDQKTTTKIVEMAAPLVLGELGSQKKNDGLDASMIFTMLQKEKKSATESTNTVLVNMAKNLIDTDNDGSIIDDLLTMVGRFFKKK